MKNKYKPGDLIIKNGYFHKGLKICLVLGMYSYKSHGFTKKIVVYDLGDKCVKHLLYDPHFWELLTEKSKLK